MFRIRTPRLRVTTSSLATLLLALMVTAPAAAQDTAAAASVDPGTAAGAESGKIPNSKCLKCHDDAELTNDAGRSMAVHETAFKAGAHKRVQATSIGPSSPPSLPFVRRCARQQGPQERQRFGHDGFHLFRTNHRGECRCGDYG